MPRCSPELSEDQADNFEISLGKLRYNFNMLLDRDMKDCLSKNLTALIGKDYRIYINNKRIPGSEQSENGRHTVSNVVQDVHTAKIIENECVLQEKRQSDKSKEKQDVLPLSTSDLARKHSKAEIFQSKAIAYSRDQANKEKIDQNNGGKNARTSKMFRKASQDRLSLCYDTEDNEEALPGDGWWLRSANSDSESEINFSHNKEGGSPASSGQNFEETNTTSEDAIISEESICGGSESEKLSASFNSSSQRSGTDSPIFYLTSFEPKIHSTPIARKSESVDTLIPMEDKLFRRNDANMTCSEIKSKLAEKASAFSEDIELDCKSVLSFRARIHGRAQCSLPARNGECLEKPPEHSQRKPRGAKDVKNLLDSKPKRKTKTFYEVKEDETNKKMIFVPYKEQAQGRKSVQNKPVKLKMQHRRDNGTSLGSSDKMLSADEADSRLLPTTLTHSANGSYSMMTPYMANVVWSVMEDENV